MGVNMNKVLFTADEMEKCFIAGQEHVKDINKPTMGEYILQLFKNKKKEHIILCFSKEEIELNIDAVESAIAICDWDCYQNDKYDSPKEQITDMYWLIDKLKD